MRGPSLFTAATGYTPRTPLDYSLGYSLRPTLNLQLDTDNREWQRPEDVDFALRSSTLTSANTLDLTYMIDLYQHYLRLSGTVATQARYRTLVETTNLTETELASLETNAASYNYAEISNTNTLSSHFLQEYEPWKATNLSYTFALPLYRYQYDRNDDDGNPIYETLLPEFKEDSITTHNVNLQLALQAIGNQQTLTLRYRLPPLDNQLSAALSLNLGPVKLTSNFSAQEEDDVWEFDPFINNATITILDELTLSANTTTNLEDKYLETLRIALRTWFVTTTFTARHIRDVNFVPNFFTTNLSTPWQEIGEEELRPTTLSVVVSERIEPEPLWRNRVSFAIDLGSTLSWDFQRYTNSYFSFNFGLTFLIAEFLDISFNASIRNSQIYRYFNDLSNQVGVPSKDFFIDLLQSINIFDSNDLRAGFFKLENITVQAVHHLADWDLTFAYTAAPLLVTTGVSPRYEWDQRISISIAWNALAELKRDIKIDRENVITVE